MRPDLDAAVGDHLQREARGPQPAQPLCQQLRRGAGVVRGVAIVDRPERARTLGVRRVDAVLERAGDDRAVMTLSPAGLPLERVPSGLAVLQVAGFRIRRCWSVVWLRDQSLTAAARRFVAYLQDSRSGALSSAPDDGIGKRRHAS
jgi:hypothetical protein